MTDLLPMFAGILWRATWLMAVALLVIGIVQRRRPLIASSLLTSTAVGLLVLPLVALGLPGLPIPVLTSVHEQIDGAVVGAGLPRDDAGVAAVATSEPVPGIAHDPTRPATLPKVSSVSGESSNAGSSERSGSRDEEITSRRQDTPRSAAASQLPIATGYSPAVSWHAVVIAVYLLGVLALTARLLAGLWLIHRLRRSATVVNGDWVQRLDAWQRRLETNGPVDLRASDAVTVPMTVGWRNPAILLPRSTLQALARHQDAVLLHELAHIRRRDFAGLLLLQLVQAVYWCHPLTWLLGLVARPLRERACDDVCIHWMGAGESYRDALLAIARQTICRPRLSLGLAMAHSSRLSRRLDQIDRSAGSDRCVASRAARMAAFCGVMTIAALAALTQLVPRQASATPSDTKDQPLAQNSGATASTTDEDRRQDPVISANERGQAAQENGGQPPESLVAILGSGKLKHWSYVNNVAWSPDGKMLGSVGGDGCLRLWDPDTGEQLQRFKSEPAWPFGAPHLTCLAFEPSGKQVAAGLGTNAVRIWDIETGNETHFLKDDAPVQRVAWHPTRAVLATGGELTARLWDLATGTILRSLESQDKSFRRQYTGDVVHAAFAPDGEHVIVGHPNGTIRYWNVATGDVTRTIAAHQVAIQALAIDAGRDLLATGDRDGKLRLWKLSTGEPVREILAHDRYLQGLAFHPRRDLIYSSGLEGTIRSWILRSGDNRLEFTASHSVGPGTLALHPTRDIIASTGHAVRLWNASTGEPHIESAGHLGGIQSLAFTPDGSRLLSAGNDTTVRVWDPSAQKQLARHQSGDARPFKSLAVLPDGRSFLGQYYYQGQFEVRTIDDGAAVKSWKATGDMGEAVAVSPDGKWVAATSRSRSEKGDLIVCELASGKLTGTAQTHNGRPYFSHDGKQVLVVGTEYQFGANTKTKSRLSVWNAETMEKVLSLEDLQGLGSIQATALSADGGTLAIAGSAFDANEKAHLQLVFWDWAKNETRLVVDMQEHRPDLMAFAPDGRSLVTAQVRTGESKVWDPRDGSLRESIRLCEGNPWSIGAVAYTADSRQFAVAMGNGVIYMIRAKPAPENVTLKVAVPQPFQEPDPDPWKSLLGKPAPELAAQGWLFGESTSLAELRGRWIILYFWNNAFSDQDVPSLMNVQKHFGNRGPEIIIVKQPHAESLEQMQAYFERISHEKWEDRPLPFRVLVDKREPNVIPDTKIETGGATHAAYRVVQARRGYLTNPLALLIDPEGVVKQSVGNRLSVREVEGATGLVSAAPASEKAFFQEYALPEGEVLRRRGPPFSQARKDYRFFRHGVWDATMTFEQGDTLQEQWATSGELTLEWILHYVGGFKNYELVDPGKALDRKIAGDWCIRAGTPREKLLAALERILQDEFGTKIHFEPATLRQSVVVASGKWSPKPLPGVAQNLGIFLTIDDAPDPSSGGGGSGPIDELLGSLGDRVRVRIVSEIADPPRERLRWQDRLVEHMQEIRGQSPAGKEKLAKLLEKLSQQTGLTFREEERDVNVWRIVTE